MAARAVKVMTHRARKRDARVADAAERGLLLAFLSIHSGGERHEQPISSHPAHRRHGGRIRGGGWRAGRG
ncbi:hypothetical protein, partial [Burkholderia gladioli]|uniref:hypothetical protein n=1 Tax=Burkholderia gladioli TaxID=28095 RepID=UPI001CC6A80A